MDMLTDPTTDGAHDGRFVSEHDRHKAKRLINTATELLFDALDRKSSGTDPDIVHMPRHLVETITFMLCEARDNI